MKRDFGCARGEVGKDLVCQFLPCRMGVAEMDAVVAKRRKQLEGLADYRKGMVYAYVTGKKGVAA